MTINMSKIPILGVPKVIGVSSRHTWTGIWDGSGSEGGGGGGRVVIYADIWPEKKKETASNFFSPTPLGFAFFFLENIFFSILQQEFL